MKSKGTAEQKSPSAPKMDSSMIATPPVTEGLTSLLGKLSPALTPRPSTATPPPASSPTSLSPAEAKLDSSAESHRLTSSSTSSSGPHVIEKVDNGALAALSPSPTKRAKMDGDESSEDGDGGKLVIEEETTPATESQRESVQSPLQENMSEEATAVKDEHEEEPRREAPPPPPQSVPAEVSARP